MLSSKRATSPLDIDLTGIVSEEVRKPMQWVSAIRLVGLCAGLRNLDAQATTAAILGTVSDMSGGTIAGATIQARNVGTGQSQ